MRKKIALLTPGYKPVPAVRGGAVETLITYLIEDNEKMEKYDIDLYTIDDDLLYSQRNKYKRTNIITIKKSILDSIFFRGLNYLLKKMRLNYVFLAFPRKYLKLLNKKKYDKIVIENNVVLYKYVHKKYRGKSEFYFHLHNNVNEPGKTKSNLKYIAKTAKNVLFVSDALKRNFERITEISCGTVLYNVIDFSKLYLDKKKSKSELRNDLGFENSKYIFLFSGRICDDKGVDKLVSSYKKFNEKYSNTNLVIIGFTKGSSKKPYERKIMKMANDSSIFLYDFMPAYLIKQYFLACDCIVIPSMYDESFGVVALEAMALKKTIISTNAGGLVEILNNKCAVMIERENIVDNLYNAMENVYKNKENSRKLAEYAYKRVIEKENFNRDSYFKNFSKLIDR